ncbi:universal stress protein, partial [Rubrivirga sp.]|uniref:universal stress protein n=1 Tax=Rubrivirga sp. TaxID=1885344 RepID=UPI003C779D0C
MPHPLRWIDETVTSAAPRIRERAAVALRDLVAHVDAGGLDVNLYVESGKAVPTVVKVAEVLGSDLVVVGPHDERPVFDRLLGSVAEGVARRSSCPVLVARRTADPDAPVPSVAPGAYLVRQGDNPDDAPEAA